MNANLDSTLAGSRAATVAPATFRPTPRRVAIPTYRLCKDCGAEFYACDVPAHLTVVAPGRCYDCAEDVACGHLAADYASVGWEVA